VNAEQLQGSPQVIKALPPALRESVLLALARSIHVVFVFAVPLAIAAFVVTWFLPEKELRETAHVGAVEVGDELLAGFGLIDSETAPELVADADEERPPESR
jgi:hypothetical protein